MPLATSWTPWTIFVALVQVALIEVIDYCTSILIQMPEPVKCQPRREPVLEPRSGVDALPLQHVLKPWRVVPL
jgi:hypothetical protein